MSFNKHKIKTVYRKVFVFKIIHNSKVSLKKVWNIKIKFSDFDCLTGYSVLFLRYLELVSFLCSLLSCKVERKHQK